jgi:type I site-specific restriction-modification system R (restriction) subunit
MSGGFAESDAEEAALGWLETLGYTVRHGPEIAYNVDGGERSDRGYRDTILQNRLHRALARLNPGLPATAVFEAYRKLLRVEGPNLLARNRVLHRMLVDGVNVEYTRSDGSIAGAQARVIDFERPEQNDWLAVNQFTVVEGQQSRRADIVIFVNGLPLGVIELKNPELAFYDALETNDSAVKVLGEPILKTIARELVATVRKNVTIDWTLRENVRAQLRVLVKRILRKYGYPPDKQEKATQTVLEQAALLSDIWAVAV